MGKRISCLTWRQFKIPNKGAGDHGHTYLMASTVVALSVWVRTSTMPTSSPRPNSLTSSFLPPTDVITDRSRPVRTMKILSLVSACLETETNPVRYWDEFENQNRSYFSIFYILIRHNTIIFRLFYFLIHSSLFFDNGRNWKGKKNLILYNHHHLSNDSSIL